MPDGVPPSPPLFVGTELPAMTTGHVGVKTPTRAELAPQTTPALQRSLYETQLAQAQVSTLASAGPRAKRVLQAMSSALLPMAKSYTENGENQQTGTEVSVLRV